MTRPPSARVRVISTHYRTKAAPRVGDVGIVLERRYVGSERETWHFKPDGKEPWWMMPHQLEAHHE